MNQCLYGGTVEYHLSSPLLNSSNKTEAAFPNAGYAFLKMPPPLLRF